MDFIFFSAFSHVRSPISVISYDIACQWSKNLWERVTGLPEDLWVDPARTRFRFAIPKFHYAAHGTGNEGGDAEHAPYSFNFMPGGGREEGEGIERCWSRTDGASGSTIEMNPGVRADALTGHFDYANWQKMITFGKTLR